ncbi:MAG: hypothetical protein ABRQ38_27775 [Candidatus Eremiobacterota bacterium]
MLKLSVCSVRFPVSNSRLFCSERRPASIITPNGYFSFNKIEPGLYILLLSKKGYS